MDGKPYSSDKNGAAANNAGRNGLVPPGAAYQPNGPGAYFVYPSPLSHTNQSPEVKLPIDTEPDAAVENDSTTPNADKSIGVADIPLFFAIGALVGFVLGPLSLLVLCLYHPSRKRHRIPFRIGIVIFAILNIVGLVYWCNHIDETR